MRCRLSLLLRTVPRGLATATITAAVLAPAAAAQTPIWRPTGNPDPLRAASLPFEPAEAEPIPAGVWRAVFQTSYFNLWSRSWHTSAIHRETGRVGLPLDSDELRELERRYPDESLYFFDLEGWRSDVFLSRGLAGGVTMSVRLPWIEIGSPHWDRVAERWHSALGLPSGDRELFPRGLSFLYLDAPKGTIERRDLADAGLGDISVSLSFSGGSWAGADHRTVVTVEAPTGRKDGLLGSGGWDAGLRWFSRWRWGPVDVTSGAGWTYLSRAGSLVGLRRADPWHLLLGADWHVRPNLVATMQVSLERSLFAEVSGGHTAEPALFRRLGLAGDLGRGTWLAFDVGQDSQFDGVAPDYSFHFTLGAIL